MTTPTSVLGLSNIQTEFGGSNPIAISEYYGVNANVPGSGTIRMASFLGISAGTIDVQPKTVSDAGVGTRTANTVFWANGRWQGIGNASDPAYNWLIGGTNSDYQIRITKLSGSTPTYGGTTNDAWTTCSTTCSARVSRSVKGLTSSTVNVAMRWTANSTVIDFATHTIEAESI